MWLCIAPWARVHNVNSAAFIEEKETKIKSNYFPNCLAFRHMRLLSVPFSQAWFNSRHIHLVPWGRFNNDTKHTSTVRCTLDLMVEL